MLYISLRQYEYICAIGRFGSLSAAAQQLNVSQPALSTALTRVESHLGHPLFTRRRGAAMALTPQGRSFIEDAEALLASAAQLEKADQVSPTKAQLRLGCFVDLAPFLLAKALRPLRAALPDLTISYKVDGFEGLISDLIDGRIDLALTYGLSMDAGFQQQILFPSRPSAIMAPDHPLAGASSVSLSELAGHPLILSNEGLSAQHVLGLFRQNGLRPLVAHRAATLEIQRSLAANHEGIAISYANPPSDFSYDGMPLISRRVLEDIAAESVVLARHGTGPADPNTAQAEQILMELLA
ncbi:LysR family transcriptional regulator [Ruegeria atlantica]|uniref:LysR family transcriptional regulator n=1 Tax=Ruegeria atlantica TaxID=81569 RepID=UPI00148165FB|nr:LysR family transcriptional regulator [Ruegeria atlantica]